jgi:hypothetical protein
VIVIDQKHRRGVPAKDTAESAASVKFKSTQCGAPLIFEKLSRKLAPLFPRVAFRAVETARIAGLTAIDAKP